MGRDCRNYGLIWHRRRRLGAKTKSRMFAFCPDGRLTTVSRAVVIGGSNDAASEQQVPLRLRRFGMTSLRNGANRRAEVEWSDWAGGDARRSTSVSERSILEKAPSGAIGARPAYQVK